MAAEIRIPHPPPTPLLIFDGDCGFCRTWIDRWRDHTGDLVDYAPYQEAAARFPQIPRAAFQRAVQLVDTDGTVLSGAAAVMRTLAAVPRTAWLYRLYRQVPGVPWLCELGYRIVARHRGRLS